MARKTKQTEEPNRMIARQIGVSGAVCALSNTVWPLTSCVVWKSYCRMATSSSLVTKAILKLLTRPKKSHSRKLWFYSIRQQYSPLWNNRRRCFQAFVIPMSASKMPAAAWTRMGKASVHHQSNIHKHSSTILFPTALLYQTRCWKDRMVWSNRDRSIKNKK